MTSIARNGIRRYCLRERAFEVVLARGPVCPLISAKAGGLLALERVNDSERR
jgi:hypothetical protein